jgi:hypothetical protein
MELCVLKVARVLVVRISRLPFGSLGTKSHLDVALVESYRIYYGGRWWLPSSPGCGESCESIVARGLS